MKKLAMLFLAAAVIYSCTEDEPIKKDEGPQTEYIAMKKEMVERFDSAGAVTDKEISEYEYGEESEFFWKKRITSGADGSVITTETREFDENGLPVKELVEDELGSVTTYKVEYHPEFYELLSKEEYEGDALIRKYEYSYDDKGKLSTEKISEYSTEEFTNADGNNVTFYYELRYFIPQENRPSGRHNIGYTLAESKTYYTKEMAEENPVEGLRVGDVASESKSEFNENGYPIHYKFTEYGERPEKEEDEIHPDEEFFKVDDSGTIGKLASITGYADKDFAAHKPGNAKMLFSYDEKGMVSKIEDYKYNKETGEFDKLHDSQEIFWKMPDINSKYDYSQYGYESQHRCYHRMAHDYNKKEIEKYEGGEIIINYSSASYELGEAPEEPEYKPSKRVIITYEVKKSGGKGQENVAGK